jgi:hypothetical protein
VHALDELRREGKRISSTMRPNDHSFAAKSARHDREGGMECYKYRKLDDRLGWPFLNKQENTASNDMIAIQC